MILERDKIKVKTLLSVRPELFDEWDFSKNKELDIYEIRKGSEKLINWKCVKCTHEYQKSAELRSRGQNCPSCSGKTVTNFNNLKTKRPDLLKIWNYEKNNVSPTEVTCGVATKVWWNCNQCEDTYPMAINKKVNGRGCSICSGYYTTNKNSFGGIYSHLLVDWDYEKNKISPFELSKSSSVKVWWKCSNCKNEYHMNPDKKSKSLLTQGSCKMCTSNVSFGEKVVYDILRNSKIKFKHEFKFDWSDNKRYDFYLPEYNTIIEVNGEQHYSESFSRIKKARSLHAEIINDEFKLKQALLNGISNYIVVDSSVKTIESIINQLESECEKIKGLTLITKLNDSKLFELDKVKTEAWQLWNDGYAMTPISDKLGIGRSTVRKYIKLGDELGRCIYDKNRKKSILI